MKILSIETAGKICAVAVSEDEKLIKEKIIEDENTHSVKLMPLVDEILKETNVDISEIDLFACDIGPGSFTGIRIGVATIKAFMDTQNKKAVGVTSLECLAKNIEEDGIVCTLLDAKNDNAYYGFFNKTGNEYKAKKEFGFDNINNILDIAKSIKEKIIFIGDASIKNKEMIEKELEDNACIILDEEKNNLNARNISLIAFNKKDFSVDSNNLNPIYLRKSSAEINKK